MAIVVPSTDSKNYAKYQECVAVLAAIPLTTSTVHKAALQDRLRDLYAELIVSLMASGKCTSTNLFAAGTYGT
jgi:hypothetical protein